MLQKNKPIANRYGLDLKICDADNISKVYQIIDFANISEVQIQGNMVYAIGGQKSSKKVGFHDDVAGELTLQTQLLAQDVMYLMTGRGSSWDGKSPIEFRNRLFDRHRFFAIIGETVWCDSDGYIYSEHLFLHRVRPKVAYGHGFEGEGEVVGTDIVFDLFENDDRVMLTKSYTDNESCLITADELSFIEASGLPFAPKEE
jgi:hypothetical protein